MLRVRIPLEVVLFFEITVLGELCCVVLYCKSLGLIISCTLLYPQLPDTLSLIYSYLYILVYVHAHCSFYTPLVYVVHVVFLYVSSDYVHVLYLACPLSFSS